jgi:parvulin-like peptidyl-prolyl isomerase
MACIPSAIKGSKGGIVKKSAVIAIFIILLTGAFIEKTNAENMRTTAGSGTGLAGEHENGIAETFVAKVNGVVISRQALTNAMKRILAGKNHMAPETEDIAEIRKTALNRLILQELAFQYAVKTGVKIDQKSIEDTVASLRAKLGGESGFSGFLERNELTLEELEAQVERNLAIDTVIKTELGGRISFSEAELLQEYEREKENYFIPEKVTVIDVILFLDAGDRESERKAAEVLAAINRDNEKNPWNLPLDGTFIVQEASLDRKKPELYEAALKLGKGGISGVIETSDSLHIIKLMEYAPERYVPFDQVRDFIEKKLITEAQQKLRKDWESELRKNAVIEIADEASSRN